MHNRLKSGRSAFSRHGFMLRRGQRFVKPKSDLGFSQGWTKQPRRERGCPDTLLVHPSRRGDSVPFTYPLKSANEISNVSQASLFGQHGVEIGLFNVLFSMPLLFGQSLSLPTQEVASHAYPMTAGFLSLLLMYCQHFHCS